MRGCLGKSRRAASRRHARPEPWACETLSGGFAAGQACGRPGPERSAQLGGEGGPQARLPAAARAPLPVRRSILVAERVALNFMQRMSGIASLTRRMVDAVQVGEGAASAAAPANRGSSSRD